MAFRVKNFASFPWRTVALHGGYFHAMPSTWLLAMCVYLNALHARSLLCTALELTTIWGDQCFHKEVRSVLRHQVCMLTSTPGLISKLRALPISYIIGGRSKRKGTKDRLLSGVVQDAHLPCQLAWICGHLGDTPLRGIWRSFQRGLTEKGKPTPHVYSTILWAEQKEKEGNTLNTSVIPEDSWMWAPCDQLPQDPAAVPS